jgi:hypothetical protein
MRGYVRCRCCGEPSFTAQYRPSFGVLCAECNVDTRTSSTRAVASTRQDHPETRAWFASGVSIKGRS